MSLAMRTKVDAERKEKREAEVVVVGIVGTERNIGCVIILCLLSSKKTREDHTRPLVKITI